jgi:hypothetical protein
VGGIGNENDSHPDSWRPAASTGYVQLTDQWKEYSISLVPAPPEPDYGQNLSNVVGGFGWATDLCANPEGATFFLDDIYYEFDPHLPPPAPPVDNFPVYTDAAKQGNHYFPTGWVGDAQTPGSVSLTECSDNSPLSGETAIRIEYHPGSIGWAGGYWVHPAENWGDFPGGYDLSGADRLTFWARSETPDSQVTFLIGGLGYDTNFQGEADCSKPIEPYPDSVCPRIKQDVTLSTSWRKFSIELPPEMDFSRVVGGFGWLAKSAVIFYLDDIIFEFD